MKFAKLRGAIRERYATEYEFARHVGMTRDTLGRKLNGKSEFTLPEMEQVLEALAIPKRDVYYYFFSQDNSLSITNNNTIGGSK